MILYPQINFGGNCEEAFRFYEQNLGGTIELLFRAKDAPNAPPEADAAVIHARLRIGGTILIANDVPPAHFQPIRSVYLYLSVDSPEEAERVYALLAEGGQIFMPIAETFFATRFAQLRDRFGVSWSLIHPKAQP